MRVQRALARAGIASRRKAEELIAAGRVTVNGETAQIGQVVDPGKDRIVVDGKPLAAPPKVEWIDFDDPRIEPSSARPPLLAAPGAVKAGG